MTTQSELHNRLAGEIVKSIVKPPIEAGGDWKDVLVLFESVVVGVTLAVSRIGGDEKVLDTVVEGAKLRLAKIRLGPIETEGKA